ncbi:hypothetical protein ACWEHA_06585 [Amycolatopsis nivea]
MPSSARRKAGVVRRSFTGEDRMSAAAGVGRGDLGFDRCSDSQRRFRAMLALHLFNEDFVGAPFTEHRLRSARSFLSYTMTVSPRFDTLVCIVPGAPRNAVGRLLGPWAAVEDGYRIAGLRVEAAVNANVYHLLHLPTGGRMVVARQAAFRNATEINRGGRVVRRDGASSFAGADIPMTLAERETLGRIPPMEPGIERMLAAIVARLDVRDPNREWAMGSWWYDPLGRPQVRVPRRERRRSLWGEGAEWELRWFGHPRIEDVTACLTSPILGLPRIRAIRTSASAGEIRGDGCRLKLVHGSE